MQPKYLGVDSPLMETDSPVWPHDVKIGRWFTVICNGGPWSGAQKQIQEWQRVIRLVAEGAGTLKFCVYRLRPKIDSDGMIPADFVGVFSDPTME